MATGITGTIGASFGKMAAGTFGLSAATWTQIGWTAGVLAGTYLFSPDGPHIVTEGSRLTDLKVTSSSYGVDIPKVYGSYRISGNIIWALQLQETKHEETQEEGKGGSGGSETNIWFTYKGTWAVALCDGEIESVSKIWFDNKLVYHNGSSSYLSNITIYTGTKDQVIDWRIQADKPDTPAYRNIAYVVFNDIPLMDSGNRLPNVTCEINGKLKNIGEVIQDIAISAGMVDSDVDITFPSVDLTGYVRSKSMTARSAIEPLLSTYNYILIEKNFKVTLVSQKQLPLYNIPEEELGASSENKLECSIFQEAEMLKSLTVRYANKSSDYETSVQSILRIDTKATEEKTVELPLVLTDTEAKQIVEINMYRGWLSRKSYLFTLDNTYKDLTAGNVVTINYGNTPIDIKVTKIEIETNGKITCTGVQDDFDIYTSNAVGSDTGINASILSTGPLFNGKITSITDGNNVHDSNRSEDDSYFDTLYLEFTGENNLNSKVEIISYSVSTGHFELNPTDVLNLANDYGVHTPIQIGDTYNIYNNSTLRILDTHTLNNSFIYSEIMLCAATGVNSGWTGCSLYSKTLNEGDIKLASTIIGVTIQGNVLNTLQDGITHVWDRNSSVILKLVYGQLTEYSEESLITSGTNYCLVGDEILQFSTVTDNLDGTYTLSNLLRGRRGTESFTSTHVSGEKFILLNSATISHLKTKVGSSDLYSSLTLKLPISALTESIQVSYTGKNLKPFSPYYFKFYRNNNDIHLSWMRRSRYLSGYMKTLPLAEATESYTLEVYNSSDILIETITDVLSSSYTYSSAVEVRFKVYQISNIIGMGYPSNYLIVKGV